MFRLKIFFNESTNSKICGVIVDITAHEKLRIRFFLFRVLDTIKMRFVQILVQLVTNILIFFSSTTETGS